MTKTGGINGTIWAMLLLVGGCVDPYRPPEIASPNSYLVVNGFFDTAPGSTTTIQLSRTQNLADAKAPMAETKATVTIESAHKDSYTLKEGPVGSYSLTGVTPSPTETYRLHIKTAKGTEYYSDYVPVITTPAIDSVSWYTEGNTVLLSVNTHDPTNNTHYYRWEYDETWELTAPYFSQYEIKSNQIVTRTEDIYRCWATESSKNIMLTSTERLSQDVIKQFPLTSVVGNSGKLTIKYSMLVRQYGMTQAGYAYYDQLAKITQSIGSIFDPQPAQIVGNIHASVNADDLVMGFFRAGTVATKRIFIRRDQVPTLTTYAGDPGCSVDTTSISKVLKDQPAIISQYAEFTYLTTTLGCVDCRYKGVNKRPSFWE